MPAANHGLARVRSCWLAILISQSSSTVTTAMPTLRRRMGVKKALIRHPPPLASPPGGPRNVRDELFDEGMENTTTWLFLRERGCRQTSNHEPSKRGPCRQVAASCMFGHHSAAAAGQE